MFPSNQRQRQQLRRHTRRTTTLWSRRRTLVNILHPFRYHETRRILSAYSESTHIVATCTEQTPSFSSHLIPILGTPEQPQSHRLADNAECFSGSQKCKEWNTHQNCCRYLLLLILPLLLLLTRNPFHFNKSLTFPFICHTRRHRVRRLNGFLFWSVRQLLFIGCWRMRMWVSFSVGEVTAKATSAVALLVFALMGRPFNFHNYWSKNISPSILYNQRQDKSSKQLLGRQQNNKIHEGQ